MIGLPVYCCITLQCATMLHCLEIVEKTRYMSPDMLHFEIKTTGILDKEEKNVLKTNGYIINIAGMEYARLKSHDNAMCGLGRSWGLGSGGAWLVPPVVNSEVVRGGMNYAKR